MLFFFDENDKVAGGSASFAGITSAADTQLHSFLYAGGNVDGDGFFTIHPAFAFTNRAFGGDNGAFAVAGRAGSDCLHLTEECIADTAYLAAAATGAAGLYAVLVFSATAAAGGTGNMFFNLNIFSNALGYLFVVELDLYPEVIAPDAF